LDKKDISIQLYTTRNFQPYNKILEFISSLGITNVELFGLEEIIVDNFKKMKEDYNITYKSSHFSFESLKNPSDIIDRAKDLNIKNLFVPAPPKKGNNFEDQFSMDEEEWISFGKYLSSFINIFEDAGLTLGYHNHSYEFRPLPSGKLPIQCIMDDNENLKFEIDIGWSIAGGSDPIYFIKKYSDKIIACHLKDFIDKDKNMLIHENQSPVGKGFINWKEILASLNNTNCELFILEHDDPKDYKKYIIESLKNLRDI